MTPTNKRVEAVVIDASIAVAVSAKEVDKVQTASATVEHYHKEQCLFFAPGAIVSESLYVLCKQLEKGRLSERVHSLAIDNLAEFLAPILSSTQGDKSLVRRAEEIRGIYSCRRTTDGIYIALAEQLAATYETVLLTFDEGMVNQAAQCAPTVKVHLLPVLPNP
jgi:predicted nucleic acid-binding protein